MARETRRQRRDARRAAGAESGAARPQRLRSAEAAAGAGDAGTASFDTAPAPALAQRSGRGGVFSFVHESWAELKKVEWPTRPQVIQGTVVVLIACFIVGTFLWVNDQIWKEVVKKLLGQ